MYVFITAVPITKLFAWGEGDSGGHDEPRPVWTSLPIAGRRRRRKRRKFFRIQ
jgi:hypothetical protein